MPTTRINKAIQECLNQCRASESPLAYLSRYCDELRQAGWTETDIRTVETAVVRLLSAISDSDMTIRAE